MWSAGRLLPIVGPNAQEFLQGYLTCDCATLQTSSLTPMALCNVQGRVTASGWAVKLDDGVGLIVHATLIQNTAAVLAPYAKFHRCSLSVDSAVELGLTNTTQFAQWAITPSLWITIDPTQQAPSTESDQAGLEAALQQHLIETKFAFIPASCEARYLPQVLGLVAADAVDFNKGCYLGQEIVARAQFRGKVKKQLVNFEFNTTQHPQVGMAWEDLECVVQIATQSGRNSTGLAVAKI